MKCPECDYWTTSKRGFAIHKAKAHKISSVPDLIGIGVIKRKLIRKESVKITDEIMAMGLKDSHSRFTMAILKTMEVVNR